MCQDNKFVRSDFALSIEIYYFSGTGNSLSVARDIAEKTEGKLISISSVMDKDSVKIEADTIGIVFPCYLAQLYGIPLLVEKFIKKMEKLEAKYIFAVCTCGCFENVNALPTLKNLSKLIKSKGGKLTAEFSIKLPMNNLNYPSKFINQNQEEMFIKAKERIEVICNCITRKKRNKYKVLKSGFNIFMKPMYLVLQNFYVTHLVKMSKEPKDTKLNFREMISLTDKSIYVEDDKCNGCETCVKVCPAHNIKIVDNKPIWLHHCEMCLACDEWCPTKAIHHWCKQEGKDYHHPEVKTSDMFRQSQGY